MKRALLFGRRVVTNHRATLVPARRGRGNFADRRRGIASRAAPLALGSQPSPRPRQQAGGASAGGLRRADARADIAKHRDISDIGIFLPIAAATRHSPLKCEADNMRSVAVRRRQWWPAAVQMKHRRAGIDEKTDQRQPANIAPIGRQSGPLLQAK